MSLWKLSKQKPDHFEVVLILTKNEHVTEGYWCGTHWMNNITLHRITCKKWRKLPKIDGEIPPKKTGKFRYMRRVKYNKDGRMCQIY